MVDFIAIKRLGGSDLGWFRSLYHKFNKTNLKGINFNKDVIVDIFYRDLPVIAAPPKNHVIVDVTIYGPGMAAAHHRPFKLVKSGNSKNWRLNGTLVDDPPDQPGRFDSLVPDDIGVFALTGRPAPTDIQVVLLARNRTEDAALQAHFDGLVPGGRHTMIALAHEDIAAALKLPGVPANHPLSWLITDPETEEALEDAVEGGLHGLRKLRARRAGRPVTREEFEEARKRTEQMGADGEALVNDYLTSLTNPGGSWDVDWVSAVNTISPFDFSCHSRGGPIGDKDFVLDVKSTRNAFGGVIHMSIGEVMHAAESVVPYHIYRVYDLTEDGGVIRISDDIRPFAHALRTAHDAAMPAGVAADSFSIPPETALTWSRPIAVSFRPVEDDVVEAKDLR